MQNLMSQWLQVKSQEDELKKKRIELEEALFAQLSEQPLAGSKTYKDGGFKMTVKTGFNESWDADKMKQLLGEYPQCAPAFTVSYRRKKTVFDTMPDFLKPAFEEALTERPAKPNFKVVIED